MEIKTEKVDEQLDSSDDSQEDEDDIQKLLLEEKSDFDISDDEEEAGPGGATVNELIASQNIKVEKAEDADLDINDEDDDDDLQNQLMLEQDFSDSDEDSDDDESVLGNLPQTENVPKLVEDNFFQELFKEADSTNETTVSVEEDSNNDENDKIEKSYCWLPLVGVIFLVLTQTFSTSVSFR